MNRSTRFFGIALIVVIASIVVFLLARRQGAPTVKTEVNMQLTSSAFAAGSPIPVLYSCKGRDISPPLAWTDPPAGAKSFALIMDDPDAPRGTWDHWVLFNIPAEMRALAENAPVAAPMAVGRNSWGKSTYGGPCPPSGTHRYYFRLYALDTILSLSSKATKADVLAAMQGHTLGMAELMGVFSK